MGEVWEPLGATTAGMVTTVRVVDMDRTMAHPGGKAEGDMR